MVSLADLRARDVTPVWQEAVAVVQELVQTVTTTTGSAEKLPDLEHVALIPNGDVVALPGGSVPDQPVRHAALMLQILLEGVAAPPELDQLVERNLAEPPQYESVAEFSRNLAFYERPGRKADIERLVGRAVMADQHTRADEELRRLKERAAMAAHSAEDGTVGMRDRRRRASPVALVLIVLMAAAAAGVVWWWNESASAIGGGGGDAAESAEGSDGAGETPGLVDQTKSAVQGALQAVFGGSEAEPSPATDEAARVDATPKVPGPRSPRPAPPRSTAETTAATGDAVSPTSATILPEPVFTPAPDVVSEGVPPPSPPPGAVFSAADADVEPPAMVRPVLPKNPPSYVPPENVGTIHVLVDEHGDVEQVRLVSPANRFHERMIVSAAKSWKFSPAYKDGTPVKYWAVIRLTI
jgi:hypothetical protein